MTSATLERQADVEILNLEDLDFEPPCDGLPHRTPCDRAPHWQALLSCGHTRLWCDQHKDRVLGIIMASMAGTFHCLDCGHDGFVDGQATIVLLEPYKAAGS